MKRFLVSLLLGVTIAACAPQHKQLSQQPAFTRSINAQAYGKRTLEEYSQIMGKDFSEQLAYIKNRLYGFVINDDSREEYGFRCQERGEMLDEEGDADILVRVMKSYNALQKDIETGISQNVLPRVAIVIRDERQLFGGEEDFFYGQTYCEMFREKLFYGNTQQRTGFPQEVQGDGFLFSYDGIDREDGSHVRYAYVFPSIQKPGEVIVYKYKPSRKEEEEYIPELLDTPTTAKMTQNELLVIELDHILRKIIMKRTLEKLSKEDRQELTGKSY